MKDLITYNKAGKLGLLEVPGLCPHCHKMWEPEPPSLITMRTSFWGAERIAKRHIKICNWCGHSHEYYG